MQDPEYFELPALPSMLGGTDTLTLRRGAHQRRLRAAERAEALATVGINSRRTVGGVMGLILTVSPIAAIQAAVAKSQPHKEAAHKTKHAKHTHKHHRKHRKHRHAAKHHGSPVPTDLDAYATLRYTMALTMWGEARGYGALGMRTIGHVIVNRANANERRYGRGLLGVIHKRKQFSCWNPSDPNHENMFQIQLLHADNLDRKMWDVAWELADDILKGRDADNVAGATYYHAETMVPYWRNDMKVVGVMFGHIFYKPKRVGSHYKAPVRHRVRHKPVEVTLWRQSAWVSNRPTILLVKPHRSMLLTS